MLPDKTAAARIIAKIVNESNEGMLSSSPSIFSPDTDSCNDMEGGEVIVRNEMPIKTPIPINDSIFIVLVNFLEGSY